MRPSLLLCTLLLCFGCARSVESTGRARDAAPAEGGDSSVAMPTAGEGADGAGRHASARAQDLQAEATAAGPRTPPRPRADDGGRPAIPPGTPAQSGDAGGPAEPPAGAAECRRDEDCTITHVPEGDCCPRLCMGRAVPMAESLKVDERQRACEARGTPCPDPVCARPRSRPVPVCTGGRCETRMVPLEER